MVLLVSRYVLFCWSKYSVLISTSLSNNLKNQYITTTYKLSEAESSLRTSKFTHLVKKLASLYES